MRYFLYTLISMALFLHGCGETTDKPIVKDVTGIAIDTPQTTKLYATDELNLSAKMVFNDGSSSDVTKYVTWEFYDDNHTQSEYYEVASIYEGSIKAVKNGFDGNNTTLPVQISYRSFEDKLANSIAFIAIKDVNYTTAIANENNVTSGKYDFNATVTFTDGTNYTCKEIKNGVIWSVEGSATLQSNEDEPCATIEFTSGDANVTLSILDKNETRSFHIN